MNIETTILRINSVVFALYGIGFIFFPGLLSQFATDTLPDTTSGMIDMRATYGGMSLAVGVLLFILSNNRHCIRIGLQGVLYFMLCMAGGRIVGIVVDGSPNQTMYWYLGLEIAIAAILFLILARRSEKY